MKGSIEMKKFVDDPEMFEMVQYYQLYEVGMSAPENIKPERLIK